MTVAEFLARNPPLEQIRGALWGELIDPQGLSDGEMAALREAALRAERDAARRAKK